MSYPKKVNHKANKVPPRNAQKAFALSTFIASTLRTYDNIDEPKLTQLVIQSRRLMKVYARQCSTLHLDELTDNLGNVWQHLLTRNKDNSIKEDDVPILIECICMLITPADFEEMFSIPPYKTDRQTEHNVFSIIAENVLELDKELNRLLGTKPYALSKPAIKEPKVKKERDKPKSKSKEKKVSSNKVKAAAKKQAHKQNILSLKERIARAKKQVSAQLDTMEDII